MFHSVSTDRDFGVRHCSTVFLLCYVHIVQSSFFWHPSNVFCLVLGACLKLRFSDEPDNNCSRLPGLSVLFKHTCVLGVCTVAVLIVIIPAHCGGIPFNSRALLSFFFLSWCCVTCVSQLKVMLNLFFVIFSLFFSAVENWAAQRSTVCKWIVYHDIVHNVICVFPFWVKFLFVFFYVCVLVFVFLLTTWAIMGSSETLVSIQYAFHRTVVDVLCLSAVRGTSNSDKKLDADLRNTELVSEAVVHCHVISNCTKQMTNMHGNFPSISL